MKVIDLRSDTVTHPTKSMLDAMASAELGDEGFADDPTVNLLQEKVADMMGKESALFMPSGTMANLSAILTHCERGDEIVLGDLSHIYVYEYGAASSLGGIIYKPLANADNGTLDINSAYEATKKLSARFPNTALVCLENTHNRCSGAVLPQEYVRSVSDVSHNNGTAVHLDGARIFNAAIAQNLPPKELVSTVDSAMFCFSKGLSCPVGSILLGTKDFIAKAKVMRNTLGGGMRQVGILAAAALVALEEMIDRLSEDHHNARLLSDGLRNLEHVRVQSDVIETNIVIFEIPERDTQELLSLFGDQGLRVSNPYGDKIRMVTHYGISEQDIYDALSVVKSVVESN